MNTKPETAKTELGTTTGDQSGTPHHADLLTVVILTYNHEDSIAEALDSVLRQQTDFSYRVLILEDASTDNTARICREYQNAYSRIITLRSNHENIGASLTLKNGLLSVESKYFAFIDGDDVWCDDGKLQEQLTALELHPECSLCGHNTLRDNLVTGSKSLFVHDEVSSQQVVYSGAVPFRVHPSSRVYRNEINLREVPADLLLDTHIYRLYLEHGGFVYINKLMSVFRHTGRGFWSGRSYWNKRLHELRLSYLANRFFDYRYDNTYLVGSRHLAFWKRVFGTRPGWHVFYPIEKVRLTLLKAGSRITARDK